MRVGDYVRSSWGTISKIIEYTPYEDDECFGITLEDETNTFYKHQWQFDNDYKVSSNIIDLIEVGDYVNGLPVESVCGTRWDKNDLRVWLAVATKYKKEYGVENSEDSYEFETLYRCIKPENIKSIVTKEQFEEMEYRIGE